MGKEPNFVRGLMCGITGIWNLKIDRKRLDLFVDSLSHRGPDGRGVYSNEKENLHLGHRRLCILDLSEKGAQPMSLLNRYWIVFNGEIYNFLELRSELEKKGYIFKTATDTEVILAAYDCYGPDCQLKFNGMWAFAIWDEKEKSLFLSRDRFGVKPLHYYHEGNIFAFASEMKSFLTLPIKIDFDEKMVCKALKDGTDLEHREQTLLIGIKRLLAGHCLHLSKRGIFVKKWWDTLNHIKDPPKDPVSAFRELFLDATLLRMRSDVPIGSALSGGLDSSAVLCALSTIGAQERQRQAKKWQHAFVALFPNTSQDELMYAKLAAEKTKVFPFYIDVEAQDLIQNLDAALFQLEEIFEMPIAPWLLYREYRKKGVVISIDGHGADELLGGYHHHVVEAMIQNPIQMIKWKQEFRELYPKGSPLKSPSWKSLLKLSVARRLSYSPQKRHEWLTIDQNESKKPYTTHPVFKNFDLLNQELYIDFHYKTLPTILRNFDRVSMAHGIEIRAPFLDFRLVTLAFSLPSSLKIGKGYTKWILRQAMKDLVPNEIRLRKSKVGFASPMIEWFHALKPFILDQVNSSSFLSSSIWRGPKIRDHVEKCYQKQDFEGARRSWEFVQANRLMEIFKSKC